MNAQNAQKSSAGGGRMPFLRGLLPPDRHSIGKEALAGLTLAIVAIPEVMGYTRIAGTPIVTGIYTMLLPMLAFAVFGASRHLVVGADSATAAILAQGLLPLAAVGSPEYMPYVCLLALMVGVLLLLCRVLRFGFIANFLSRTVLAGFLAGVGLQVAFGQVGGMLGLSANSGAGLGGVVRQLWDCLAAIPQTNLYALLAAGVVLLLIFIPPLMVRRLTRGRWLKKVPWLLVSIIAAAVLGFALNLPQRGVPSVGIIAGGLPPFTLPALSWSGLLALLPVAVTIVLVIITQSAATSAAYANRYGEHFNENTDLLGLGLANLAAGFTGAFVVNGSPTKTQLADEAGGRSQLANLFAVMVAAAVLLFLTRPLQFLPDAALCALVFVIGLRLIDFSGLARIYRQKPNEFVVAVLTAAAVIVFGAAVGIVVAMGLSLIEYLRRSYRPKNSLMTPGRIKDGRIVWTWQPVASRAQAAEGLIIYHFAAAIYYANADLFAEEVTGLVQGETAAQGVAAPHGGAVPQAVSTLRAVLLDFSAIADVDFTGGQILLELYRKLEGLHVQMGLLQVEAHVMAQLERYGVAELVGEEYIYADMGAMMGKFGARTEK